MTRVELIAACVALWQGGAWSYIDAMDLMVTACARALPEPSRVSEGMAHQLDLLTDA